MAGKERQCCVPCLAHSASCKLLVWGQQQSADWLQLSLSFSSRTSNRSANSVPCLALHQQQSAEWLQLSPRTAAFKDLQGAKKAATIPGQLLPCSQVVDYLRAQQGSMLTGKSLCRSRAEDLRAQLLEFQAPREESRQQMVDWLKDAAGEAKQVSMWCREGPAAVCHAPKVTLVVCQRGALKCCLCAIRGALEAMLCASRGALKLLPHQRCTLHGSCVLAKVTWEEELHARQRVWMNRLKFAWLDSRNQGSAEAVKP